MTFGGGRTSRVVAMTMLVRLLGPMSVAGQTEPEPGPQMSDNVFQNIQILKGIPVDEFMDAMGMFAAALGYDCSSCHDPGIITDRDAFAVSTPAIERARGMIVMMNTLNRTYFGGVQRVSCFTCHRGDYRPEIVPSLALQYGELMEDPSAMEIFPDQRATADQVFDDYLEALGGSQSLAALTSFVATGTFEGFNTGQSQFPIEIYARAPGQRSQIVGGLDGDEIKTYDGRSGWVAEGWRPLPLMTLTGGNLEGARLEAMTSFPASIRQAFTQWQATSTMIDDRRAQLLQGSTAGQLPVNFYFDNSGLLMRIVRWNRTVIGTVPTQIDYGDYREVAGVKMPFRTIVTWTGGQNTILLNEVRPNVPIDAARFARPAPFQRR